VAIVHKSRGRKENSLIHQYKLNGYNIVMDVGSGSVHIVDDIVYDMIPLVESLVNEGIKDRDFIHTAVLNLIHCPSPSGQMMEAADEVLGLAESGRLFAPDIYENYIFDFKHRRIVVKALCLHVAHACNLACRYCFAQEGEYHGKRAMMSFPVGKKALDFLVANSGDRVHLEVDFFGGEPLMNFQVVKELVEYGRALEKPHNKEFRFTLTTNGILLNDEIVEFMNREMSNVVFSLDGRKQVHDRMRPTFNGQGSYDIVAPKIRDAVMARGSRDYYVRGTYTRHNLDFSKDVLHLADMGFHQISIEPVVAVPREPYGIRETDLPRLKEEYGRLAMEMAKRPGLNFFHFMIDLEGGPCVAKRLSGCGSGTEYLAVTPWGDLYPCHQFVGNERYLMGNVDVGIVREDIRDEFKNCNIYTKEKCRKCFARFYCGGGCAANAVQFRQDLNGVYEIGCELERKRVECAVMLKAAMAEEMP
jgi:uncharacterized protein